MPYVNFKLTPENLTTEKKATLIKSVTELLQRELNKNPETTIVTIDVVQTDNWGIGGDTVTQRRKMSR
ncbi:MAG: tautomerase family protein [Arenicella sp.]